MQISDFGFYDFVSACSPVGHDLLVKCRSNTSKQEATTSEQEATWPLRHVQLRAQSRNSEPHVLKFKRLTLHSRRRRGDPVGNFSRLGYWMHQAANVFPIFHRGYPFR